MKLKTKIRLLGLAWMVILWTIMACCLAIPFAFFYDGWEIALLFATSAYALCKIQENLKRHIFVILMRVYAKEESEGKFDGE